MGVWGCPARSRFVSLGKQPRPWCPALFSEVPGSSPGRNPTEPPVSDGSRWLWTCSWAGLKPGVSDSLGAPPGGGMEPHALGLALTTDVSTPCTCLGHHSPALPSSAPQRHSETPEIALRDSTSDTGSVAVHVTVCGLSGAAAGQKGGP